MSEEELDVLVRDLFNEAEWCHRVTGCSLTRHIKHVAATAILELRDALASARAALPQGASRDEP